jgi:hypothetical protein
MLNLARSLRSAARPIALFASRALDAMRNPQRPPVLAIVFPCDEGRMHYCIDVEYAARIALTRGTALLQFVQLSPLFWNRETYAVPAHAWRPWRTVTTGDFLARVQRAKGRVGTYHTSGAAALVREGHTQREAHVMVRAAAG